MAFEKRTIGVAVYALRRDATRTELLLVRHGTGGEDDWRPVAGSIRPDETEVGAAVRGLAEETALAPERVYATGIHAENRDPSLGETGRIGIFVAYVPQEARVVQDGGGAEHTWLEFEAAWREMPHPSSRAVLAEIRQRFLQRPPDEALRVR